MPTFTDLLPTDTVVRRHGRRRPALSGDDPDPDRPAVAGQRPTRSPSASAPAPDQSWQVAVSVSVNPLTGAVDPPQAPGSMTIRNESASGGTFDSTSPVQPLSHVHAGRRTRDDRTDALPRARSILVIDGESWSHVGQPADLPEQTGKPRRRGPGLTIEFLPRLRLRGLPCAHSVPRLLLGRWRRLQPVRIGVPLTPVPNPAEGLLAARSAPPAAERRLRIGHRARRRLLRHGRGDLPVRGRCRSARRPT